MSSMEEKLGQESHRGGSARCYLKKHLSKHYSKVLEESEIVRVWRPTENKIEIWEKVRQDKGDWLLELKGSYPMGNDNEN